MEENGCLTPDSLEEFDLTEGFNSNINNSLRYLKNDSHELIPFIENSNSSNVHFHLPFTLNNRISDESTSVPPLNLLSEESSIIEATDTCKEAFEIDLRAPYKGDMHISEQQQNNDEIVSDHWKQYIDQLNKLKLDQHKSYNSAKVDYNNRSTEPIRTKNDHDFLLKEVNRTKNDFIRLNKINLGYNKLVSPKTYGRLFEEKLNRNYVNNNPENYSSTHKSKLAQRHRICFSSDPTLCKVIWRDVKINSQNHLTQQQKIYDYSQYHESNQTNSLSRIDYPTSHKSDHIDSRDGLREDSINRFRVNHANSQLQYRHTLPQTVNSNGVSNVIQSPLKRKNDSVFPTSVSGVYRLGLLQQVELTKAHKQFCHKLNSNFTDYNSISNSLPVHTRLDALCSPNPMIKHANLLNSLLTKHKLCDSSVNHNSTKGMITPNKITDTILQQYMLRNYNASSPLKPIKPMVLSQNFNSHEYEKKLTPKFRQNGYTEYLRKCQLNKLPKLTCYKTRPILQNEKDSDVEVSKNIPKDSIPNQITNDTENFENKCNNLLNSSNGIVDNSSTSQTDQINLTETVSSPDRPEPKKDHLPVDLSKEDLDKIEANKKREKMLNYAKKVQERYQEKYQQFIKNDNLSRQSNLTNSNSKLHQPNQTSSVKNWENLDPKLMEMIRRHREERKQVEEMQKSLKIH